MQNRSKSEFGNQIVTDILYNTTLDKKPFMAPAELQCALKYG
jgi:hypothetical protein